jgi:amino acid transporter
VAAFLTWENFWVILTAASPGLLVAILSILATSFRSWRDTKRREIAARRQLLVERTVNVIAALSAQAEATANPTRNAQSHGKIESDLRTSRILFNELLSPDQDSVREWLSVAANNVRFRQDWVSEADFDARVALPLLSWLRNPSHALSA